MTTGRSDRRLRARLLGPDVRIPSLLLVGAVIGTITAIDAQEMLKPLALFIVPAWFLYVGIRLNGFLRYPRSLDLAFVLGIDFSARQRIGTMFFNRKFLEIVIIGAGIVTALGLVRGVRFGPDTAAESLAYGSIMVGGALVLGFVFWLALHFGIGRPKKHDPRSMFLLGARTDVVRTARSRLFLACARVGSSPLSGHRRTILKRQVLYLLRYDLFGFLAFNAASFPLAAALVWFTRGTGGAIVDILIAMAPLVIFSVLTETMSVSAERLRRCRYYDFLPGDLVAVHTLIAALLAAPYAVLYLIEVTVLAPRPVAGLLGDVIGFLASLAGFVLIMAWRWTMPAWNGTSIGLAGLAGLAAMLGIAIPVWGFVFPVSVCGVAVVVARAGILSVNLR